MDETFEIGNGNYVRVDPTGGATVYNEDNILPLNSRQTAALLEVLKCAAPAASSADIAAAAAHRACCGSEHDPANGKLHGYCVVCGVPWPCDTAQYFLRSPAQNASEPKP